ncbi:MAG: tungsten cofactor oxidoreductase radical SAM maturase [Chloroflexota bacterium]|nr:MAG: tungsten cofactor oxidoreductase radical SAM maturase [Chloroflexota bacterium]
MSEFIPLLLSSSPPQESLRPLPEQTFLPDAYRLPDGAAKGPISPITPRVVFIEVTNRCNLLCQTCPRTFFDREPLKTLTCAEFVQIAEQFPEMRRVLLHGIGEPLLNKELPHIIKYLKGREVEVIINSNGTLLTPVWQEALVESGLDQYRCSIDGARPETYARIRGAHALPKLVEGLAGLVKTKARRQSKTPRLSIWCVGTKENLAELPDLVRLAARLGVPELYLQRLVYFAHEPEQQFGMAHDDRAIFGPDQDYQEEIIDACELLSAELGVDFRASGARAPRHSLEAARPADFTPWQECMRPWTTAYVTANGNCLPCCISPFATSHYHSLILGNLFERPFTEIWNDHFYRQFRTTLMSLQPHQACASCGVYWSL